MRTEKFNLCKSTKKLLTLITLLTLGVGQMWATYYYRGEKNSWEATAMTDVNGIYSYYSTSGTQQFKLSNSTSTYAYNYSYVSSGYKQTDVSDIGDYGKDNCYCWQSGSYYILIFNPNTSVNSTNKPIICAATALPSAGFESDGNTISYYNNVDGNKQSSALDRTDGTTIDLTSKAITSLYLKAFNTKMYQHYEVNLLGASNYHFYYKIHRTAETAGSTGFTEVTSADGYSAGTLTWGDFDGSKYRKPTYYVTANQSLLSGLGSGLYTMSYYFTHVGTTETYRLPSTSSKYNELKWKIPVPAVTSGAVTSNGSGSGTDGSPFTVADGSNITFTASGSQASADANSVLYVKWGDDAYSSTTTKTITPTTTKQSMTVKLKYYNSADELSGAETTLTIYYQSTLTPSIGISSISPSPANSGDEVTITASRQNAGTANITYQYSLNGTSGWTTIGSATSSTTKTWTVPAITATTTYYFRAQMTYSATTYTSDVVSLKAYGKKTIKVKDTNSWGANFKIHRWGGDDPGTEYPGETTNITSAGGQWKQVVLYSSSTDFIFCNGSSSSTADANKTANKTYAGMTDGYCYVIQSGSGASLTLTSTDCPSAPSVTTASASSVATTSATFNASGVNANNDAITDYGFKWGTTDACSSGTVTASNLGAGTTFSASKTGLTNGTTYYYKAYATNGFGTTYGSVQSFRTKYVTTVTLNPQGGTGGTASVTATEGSAMPSGQTAPGKTGYTFGGYYKNTGGSGTQYYSATMTSAHSWDVAASTATIHAKWTPITYTIHFNGNGNTSGSISNQTGVTYDSGTTITANAFVKTGYNFAGWATTQERANAGTVDRTDGAAHGNLASTQGATAQLWAVWTPKTCTVNFDFDSSDPGHGDHTSATTSTSATYDAAMTSVTPPTAATGYAFMGYFTGADGAGTQYYDGSGNSAKNWAVDTEDPTTLYAYYKKAEITGITFTGGNIVSPSTSTSVTAVIEPTPVAPTTVCWRVLYNNDNPLAEQPTFTPASGASVSFTSPEASGTYKLEAVLHTGSGCGGTELSTYVATFQVAGDHTVTILYQDASGNTIKASESMIARPLSWSDDITAPDIFGYTFDHWYAQDGVYIKANEEEDLDDSEIQTIKIRAIYDGRLVAKYTQKSMIYFKNTLNWENVYVNFLDNNDYWNNPKGSGNESKDNCNKTMTRLGETDIWYYDYGAESINPTIYVSFTSESQNNYKNFYGTSVVYPAHYYQDEIHNNHASENGFKAATPMFVPLAGQTKTTLNSNADYYNRGYWTKFTPGTGYVLEIYNTAENALIKSIEFTSENDLMPMKAVADLEAGVHYKYQIRRGGTGVNGCYLGTSKTGDNVYMSYTDHTAWQLSNSSFHMLGVITTAAGNYTFTLAYANTGSNDDHRFRITVDYPASAGDFQILYNDRANWSQSAAHSATWIHPSRVITARPNGVDTISFYVYKNANTALTARQVSSINASTGAITWAAANIGASASMSLSGVAATGVYNFVVTQNAAGTAISSIENIGEYTGNYYIRTDAANSKWDNYTTDGDHLMTYSEYSIEHGGYSHYYCHWVKYTDTGRKNVKFCIANDYSPCISDTLTREDNTDPAWTNINNYIEASGDLLRDANVRYMWNIATNKLSRAYVDGAQNAGSEFLLMLNTDATDKIRWADESALTDKKVTFSDNENWIYEADIQAKPNAQIRLKSTWGETTVIEQYFKGSSSTSETLIGGSGSTWYDIRLLYDFKTNRLVAAYKPSGNITDETAINADIMFIREHQGDISQLTFSGSGTITKIKTAYGVIRFNKWILNNREPSGNTHGPLAEPKSLYERSLFWISFPFRVKLSEVFGFGTYGSHWAIQYYDGADRAARGHFLENGTFWKWLNRSTAYLEPNQGYLLAIDVDLLGINSDVWGPESRSEQIELYFPSTGNMPNLTSADVVQTIPEHTCTINRAASEGLPDTGDPRTSYNRTIFDSHWNVMSVPTYVNTDDVTFANTTWTTEGPGKRGPNFLYTWNSDDNTITATAARGYTYHAMHSYMVQYCNTVTWAAKSGSPYTIVARKTYEEAPREIEFRLEIQQNEKMIDRTYVVLSNDEEVSANFAFGEDMVKEFNARKAAIFNYTADNVGVAGNTMPMSEQTTVIPVGLEIPTAGEYTFAIPDGTEGVGVILVDNVANTRTNLSALDYTVNLTTGTHDGRFVLEISPIHNATTGIEAVSDEGLEITGARKMIIDQKLYIVKDGKLFDATGKRVE
jgi:hypothetical protein